MRRVFLGWAAVAIGACEMHGGEPSKTIYERNRDARLAEEEQARRQQAEQDRHFDAWLQQAAQPPPPALTPEQSCALDREHRTRVRQRAADVAAKQAEKQAEADRRQREFEEQKARERAELAARREAYIKKTCRRVEKPLVEPALCVDERAYVRVCNDVVGIAVYYQCPENGPDGARGLVGWGGIMRPDVTVASNPDPSRIARLAEGAAPPVPLDPGDAEAIEKARQQAWRDRECEAFDRAASGER